MKIYAYENNSDEIRFNSSSGGLFTYLAERILEKKGVICGAAFDSNWAVYHAFATNLDEVSRLRKSKYVNSNLGECFKKAKEFLDEGRFVLFTGCPCHVAALKKYLQKDYDKLLCAEIVCHGSPQEVAWNSYLDELLHIMGKTRNDIADIDFRDKTTGWKSYSFTVRFRDGSKYTEPANLNYFMRLFISDLIIKEGCFNCPFKQPSSMADITMGDFWGINHLFPERYSAGGTSVVIVNTAQGERWLENANLLGEFELDEVSYYNIAINSRPVKPANYDKFNMRIKRGKSIIKMAQKYYSIPLYRKIGHKIIVSVRNIVNGR